MLRIADKVFDSHLFTGTGKFATADLMVDAIRASGSQLVTLAMKRVNLRRDNDAILRACRCCPTPPGRKPPKRPCLPPAWRGKRSVPAG